MEGRALFSRVLLMIHCVSIFFRDTEIDSQSRNLLERSQLLLLLHTTLQRDLFVSSMTTFNFFWLCLQQPPDGIVNTHHNYYLLLVISFPRDSTVPYTPNPK